MYVKICGLTTLTDAEVAVEAGADLLGFIFYEKSPRAADARTVAAIVAALKAGEQDAAGISAKSWPSATGLAPELTSQDHRPPFTGHRSPLFVGVFVNASLEQIVRTLNYCDLDLAQLHGEEPPELLAALPGRAYRALRPRSDEEAAAQAASFGRFGPARGPRLLVDAWHPSLRGGSGQTGDWRLAATLAAHYPLLLAGGLTPDNVAAAITQVQPWGVDVAGGVEAAPGRKDHAKVRAFLAAVTNIR
ncbi:MAG: phosphoribosylanthranilate isomerase [Caldilineales bacterium]